MTTCDPLAYSGPGAHLGVLLVLGIAFLFVGAGVLLMSRRRGRVVALALLLVTGAAVSITGGTATQALASGCPAAQHSLTITQTSVVTGMAPGIGPMLIAGIVRNNGTDSTDIVAIDVEITAVHTARGAVSGLCDPSDYVLSNSRMPVGRTLLPGGSTAFAGASIGFSNKSTNQDACQGATLQLLYTANPR